MLVDQRTLWLGTSHLDECTLEDLSVEGSLCPSLLTESNPKFTQITMGLGDYPLESHVIIYACACASGKSFVFGFFCFVFSEKQKSIYVQKLPVSFLKTQSLKGTLFHIHVYT